MEDRILKRFFGNDVSSSISVTPNYKSTLDLKPQYRASRNYSNKSDTNIGEYKYPPPNLPNQRYLSDQIYLGENNYSSINRRNYEVAPNYQAVYFTNLARCIKAANAGGEDAINRT
jgi:hypothetical protein